MTRPTSRLTGFFSRPIAERRAEVAARLPAELAHWLDQGGGLPLELADNMVENVVGTMGLPFAVATNFVINDRDVLMPMVTEEPSVVAAASNAARLCRAGGGFTTRVDASIVMAQVHLDGAAARTAQLVMSEAPRLLALGNAAVPNLVARGGGCRDVAVRALELASGAFVVEVAVDVQDAMGANLVDTVAEALAPSLLELVGGRAVMRILSNLCMRRLARASCRVPIGDVGEDVAEGIVRATWFARADIGRAATHNKGIMNGVDAVALATGQDVRALEAGAHAFASLSGSYQPLSRWRLDSEFLHGEVELPLAVGVVGAATTMPSSRAGLALLGVPSARELAGALAATGLAANLAALRALVAEGIQQGHMRMHRRRGGVA